MRRAYLVLLALVILSSGCMNSQSLQEREEYSNLDYNPPQGFELVQERSSNLAFQNNNQSTIVVSLDTLNTTEESYYSNETLNNLGSLLTETNKSAEWVDIGNVSWAKLSVSEGVVKTSAYQRWNNGYLYNFVYTSDSGSNSTFEQFETSLAEINWN